MFMRPSAAPHVFRHLTKHTPPVGVSGLMLITMPRPVRRSVGKIAALWGASLAPSLGLEYLSISRKV